MAALAGLREKPQWQESSALPWHPRFQIEKALPQQSETTSEVQIVLVLAHGSHGLSVKGDKKHVGRKAINPVFLLDAVVHLADLTVW
jgi:hypothetical protein